MSDNNDLRGKIDEAKQQLPLPTLMKQLGYGANVNTHGNARCIFHDDQRPSFSLQEKADGTWYWHCFAGCGAGDEIAFLQKLKGLSATSAINLYLKLAGFPSSRSPKSHEYSKSPGFPESLKSPEYPVSPVSPVSNGQGSDKELEKELKNLATRYACTQSNNEAGRRLFEIARGIRAIKKKIGRKLSTNELMVAFNEWHRVSGSWLDSKEDYLASFLAGLGKVRVPTGEGDTIKKALEAVSKLRFLNCPSYLECETHLKVGAEL
jgi:CHC2 zinc finger